LIDPATVIVALRLPWLLFVAASSAATEPHTQLCYDDSIPKSRFVASFAGEIDSCGSKA